MEETKFRIVHCNGKTMTLESEYSRLELRKF
ncbi:lipocalin-like domain-containing protein [Bacteroides caecigallinarum]|nr:lipocalin-like domain-containing protein [Bacteroides caecigallinarum]MCF2582720.1 lipocalin-like domain-containing protein [Bacteroides caecigallinarum]